MSGLFRTLLLSVAGTVALLAGAGSAHAAEAVSDEFAVREWHAEAGLPNDDVFQVFQDRAGYLWLGCRNVLCRFDGTSFLAETAPEGRETFHAIAADLEGALLLAPRDGDLLQYRDGHYTRLALPAPYAGRAVGGIVHDRDGARWYALRGAAIRVSASGVESFGADAGIAGENWTRLATDSAGNVWLANENFLARYEAGRLRRLPFSGDANELRLISSRHEGPWLITPDRLVKFGAGETASVVSALPPLLGAHFVNAALEDRSGALWIGTRSAGLSRVTHDGPQAVEISSDTVTSLVEDRDGVLWVGTTAGGLHAISRQVYTLYNKTAGLAATAVSTLCADHAGDIWLANGDAGVARIRGSQIDQWPLTRNGRGYAAGSITAHPEGGVWVTAGTGAAIFRVTGGAEEPAAIEDLSIGRIHATTFTSSNGDLWFAMADRRVGRFRAGHCEFFGPADGVNVRGVRTFAETKNSLLLVGTNDGALLQFDGTRFVPRPEPVQVSGAINAIQTLDDEVWLGTAANGIAVCSGTRVTFLRLTDGLPDDSITHLMPDGNGYLWCGSSRGVFRLALDEVRRFVRGETRRVFPLRLGKDEGLGQINCQGIYGPGVARSRDGRIWFATRQGALAVDPSAETLAQPLPKARIEQVLTDETPQPLARPCVVGAEARKLEIRYSVLCLSAPSRVHVRYRLAGFDTGWTHAKPGATAVYPRLPPGNYRFEITAGFDESASADSVDTLDIVVPPIWWQTYWFRVPAFAVLVGLVGVIVRIRSHRRLQRRIANLEREAAVSRVRERIARDIHDDVGASLTRISLLAQPGAVAGNGGNLHEIDQTAREVTRSLDEIVWAVNPQYDTLEGLASYLANFAQKFLGSAKIRCRLLVPPSLPALSVPGEMRHDLFLCSREILHNIVKHSGAAEAVLQISYDAPQLKIVISDNGRGLTATPPPPAADSERIASGQGLKNLHRRMERLGGRCTIDSPATGGAVATLEVELRSENPPA